MRLIIREANRQQEITIQPDALLLDVLRRNGSPLHAPCGGKGTCQKCRVDLAGIGPVLACQTRLTPELATRAGLAAGQPLTVALPEPAQAHIATDGILPDFRLSPLIYRGRIDIPQPSLADQRPDDERFETAAGLTVPDCLLAALPAVLRDSDFQPSFDFRRGQNGQPGEIQRFTASDSPEPLGLAVDIGTTTLAAYLYGLDSGERLAAVSALNPQRIYGADVISRIEQASASADLRQALQTSIVQAIDSLAVRLVGQARTTKGLPLTTEQIGHYVLTGNTTMVHLLCGWPAEAIARSPFIPVSCRTKDFRAADLGFRASPQAICQILPSIASYVGADITAGILACSLHRQTPGHSALLLDIGTNGEIVLAGPRGMIACSTAAGPAFEGANILCGMGGVAGAIDEVGYRNGDLAYSVISSGNGGPATELAAGLCGSGLVAAIACLLDCGILDETGRITDEPESLPPGLRRRLIDWQGQPAVVLAPAELSSTGQPVLLTQKDIREVQNAKAALAAGIELLIRESGLTPELVDQAFLAGGFGNYLDVAHAFRIGLMPAALRGRTRAVGNTAGMGAVLCLLNQESLLTAQSVARSVRYLELSGDPRFTDLYVEAMLFPAEDD